MDAENQHSPLSSHDGSSSTTPEDSPPLQFDRRERYARHARGNFVPNRIFVGGIDCKMTEADLRHIFSQHGAVREAKVVTDRFGQSKRYGFVTFETQEEALRILDSTDGIFFQDKRLCVAPAFRKHHFSFKCIPNGHHEAARPYQMSYGSLYLTTSAGNPYTYHNGVAYFHCPNMTPPPPQWTPPPQVVVSQAQQMIHPQHAPPPYQGFAPAQWSPMHMPLAGTVLYAQQSEYLYQSGDPGSIQPGILMTEEPPFEFPEPPKPHLYAELHVVGATGPF